MTQQRHPTIAPAMMFVLGLIVLPTPVHAICISLTVTPAACNFKNEDTNLWWYQPPLKWTNDEKFATSIDAAEEFVHQYLNSVKATGDDAIRWMHEGKAAAQETLNFLQTTQIAIAEARNDPWNLKAIYTDLLCDTTFSLLESQTGIRTGSCSASWIADIDTLLENTEVIEKIREIVANPYLVLGEEWGDVADDIDRVMAEYDELETMARNLDGDAIEEALEEKFRRFEGMLANPMDATLHREVTRTLIDETLENTLRDTLMATQANSKNLYGAAIIDPDDAADYRSDLDESRSFIEKNRNAVGRMQAMELANMGKSLQGQAWLDILEQQRAMGYLIGLDMQSEMELENQSRSEWYEHTRELHPPETRRASDDGVALGF